MNLMRDFVELFICAEWNIERSACNLYYLYTNKAQHFCLSYSSAQMSIKLLVYLLTYFVRHLSKWKIITQNAPKAKHPPHSLLIFYSFRFFFVQAHIHTYTKRNTLKSLVSMCVHVCVRELSTATTVGLCS